MAYYIGSWNPLHEGHLAIANWYESRNDRSVKFVLARNNVDKPKLKPQEIVARRSQFMSLGRTLIITSGPTYIATVNELHKIREKSLARVMSRVSLNNTKEYLIQTHLVGVDTLRRIYDPKYTFNSPSERDRVVKLLTDKCRFIVFPRNGVALDDLVISAQLRDVCTNADGFENSNISSTAIRNQSAFTRKTEGRFLNIGDEYIKKHETHLTVYKVVSLHPGIIGQYGEEFFEVQPEELVWAK